MIVRSDAVPELLLNLTSSTKINIVKNSVDSSISMKLEETLVNVHREKKHDSVASGQEWFMSEDEN